ncbi:MAG: guanylate kinase [Lewinellaceae bacterium]|nr:guanylate kinase [Lewinellaceae bacterium]
MSKLLLFAAPSGAGKTTIVRHLLKTYSELAFSVSATTRPPRPHEVDGKDYYFISPEKFRELVAQDAFVEWEEVYEGLYYGTLKAEVERLWKAGKFIIFDIDVKGALNIKRLYQDKALAVFVRPPSIQALRQRLQGRSTEDEATLRKRMARAEHEMAYEDRFDLALVNDSLEEALKKAEQIVEQFIYQP